MKKNVGVASRLTAHSNTSSANVTWISEDPEGSYTGRRLEAWEIESLPNIQSRIADIEEYLGESEKEVVVATPLAA